MSKVVVIGDNYGDGGYRMKRKNLASLRRKETFNKKAERTRGEASHGNYFMVDEKYTRNGWVAVSPRLERIDVASPSRKKFVKKTANRSFRHAAFDDEAVLTSDRSLHKKCGEVAWELN